MAHAWKACWCNSLTSSNLVSSARIGAPETVEIIRFPGFRFDSPRLSVPSRYPPFGHLWPRPAARVTYRNRRFRKRLRAFARRVFVIEVRPRPMCPVSGPIRIPSCFPRSFFVLVRNNPGRPPRSAMRPMRSGPARRFPLTPSDERHTNAYLNLGTLPTPLPRFLGTFLSTEATSQVRTMPSTKHPYRHICQHITFAR